MKERKPAEVFPPGEFLREELEARGWTQGDLASILGRSQRLVNEVITGKRSLTPETAKGLSEALGTSADFWLNLQNTWSLAQTSNPSGGVSRRAKLYTKAPVNEMIRRGWIEGSDNVDVLEKRVLEFLEIEDIDEETSFCRFAARKSTSYANDTSSQRAWILHAKHLAETLSPGSFSEKSIREALRLLKTFLSAAEEIRKVPTALAECGIRLLVVEPLKGTKIDGASFWLDERSPVVVLSLRYDRIDHFWHTLIHELGHIKHRDSLRQKRPMIDSDLLGSPKGEEKPREERLADEFAEEFLIPGAALRDFISAVRPLYSTARILDCANRLGVHPGILVGRLQFRGEVSYAHSRGMLAKVRDIIVPAALSDGWGSSNPLH